MSKRLVARGWTGGQTVREYRVVIERAGTGYSAYVPDLPGCVSTGRTLEETKANIREAAALYIEQLQADGAPIPEPSAGAELGADRRLEQRYTDGMWDEQGKYLALTRSLYHNPDYLEFLVAKVWKLDKPCRVAEFGCGSGRMALMLMPLLREGSSYTGFDQSSQLVSEARAILAGAPFPAEVLEGSAFEAPLPDESFDVTLSHALLMHIPEPERALAEMIRVTRNGGLVITCEANRNGHSAAFHIDETNEQESTPLGLFQRLNIGIRGKTGVDHDIGLKMPILMHKAGLTNIGARISDAVRLIFAPVESEEEEALFQAICHEGYGSPLSPDEIREKGTAYLTRFGIPPEEAAQEIEREITRDFAARGRGFHTVFPGMMSWSFGTVDRHSGPPGYEQDAKIQG